jgi:hypothetical protein
MPGISGCELDADAWDTRLRD